jgi:Cu(I)/Ag(I) efflux system membrane protein CusA/SilA
MRDFRSDLEMLKRLPVTASGQQQVPLGNLASVSTANEPSMLRTEDGLVTGYVYVDLDERDPESYIAAASQTLLERAKVPAGYSIAWSGEYESMQRIKSRLRVIVPTTLFLVCGLLYLNTGSLWKTMIVALAIPFSAVGAVWFLYFAGFKMSVAVWVGLIALLGIDAETGVFMLLYLDLSLQKAREEGRLSTVTDLQEAIVHGAAKRLRPKFMTFATTWLGLLPLMFATGTGSDVMKRIAAPMIGGILTSFVLELLIYPAIYEAWKSPKYSGRVASAEKQDNWVPQTGI